MTLTPAQRARLAQLVADKARSNAPPSNRAAAAIRRARWSRRRLRHARLRPSRTPFQADGARRRQADDRHRDRPLGAIGVQEIVVNTHHSPRSSSPTSRRAEPRIVFSREEILKPAAASRRPCRLGVKPFYAINGKIIWLNGKTDALVRLAEVWTDADMDGLFSCSHHLRHRL
jgi:hypothetical protein